jgi:hypothetical protein
MENNYTIYVGMLVNLNDVKGHRKNGIVTWKSLTMHTYEGEPKGSLFDMDSIFPGEVNEKACFLYRVYWPNGDETMELGDELIPVA